MTKSLLVVLLSLLSGLVGYRYGQNVVQQRWIAAYHALKQSKIDCWRLHHDDESCLTKDVIGGVEFTDPE